jgi:outer membrane protein W
LRAASGHHQVDPDTAKVQELDHWMNTVKHEGHSSKDSKDNMVFFRGGFAHSNDRRGGFTGVTDGGLLNNGLGASGDPLVGGAADKDAWYFGAGFDWSLNDNLFGMMQGTEVMAELMFDYKEFGQTKNPVTGQSGTNNQLTLAASPKIKFLKGSAFRPWLIPAGFEISVISPPEGAVTVLSPGMMFGAGADYKIWKDIYVGADVRYHQSFKTLNVDTDGVTAGGYLGLGF